MILLAQAATEVPKEFAVWSACLAFLVLLTNECIKLVGKLRGKAGTPPNELLEVSQKDLTRRVVVLEEAVVGEEWFTKVEKEIELLRGDSTRHREEKDRTDSIHRAAIYKGIDKVRSETGQHIEDVRKELSKDIKEMPFQIVALLKNKGSI